MKIAPLVVLFLALSIVNQVNGKNLAGELRFGKRNQPGRGPLKVWLRNQNEEPQEPLTPEETLENLFLLKRNPPGRAPMRWVTRSGKEFEVPRQFLSPGDTRQNVRLMNALAGDIVGDLEGLLTDINNNNALTPKQRALADALTSALRTADLDTDDPDRLLRLS